MEIPLFVDNNHLMARLSPGPWIIDTGSAGSFSTTCPILPVGSTSHAVGPDFQGFTMEKLRHLSGLQAVGLVGNDILARHHVGFHLTDNDRTSVVQLAETPLIPSANAQRLTVRMRHGAPVIDASLAGTGTLEAVFDTGAQISYVADRSMLTGQPICRATDFIPDYGQIVVDVHLIGVRLGGIAASLRFAYHAEATRKMERTESRAIIGWEVLRHGPLIYSLSKVEIWA
jgi:hypothetical protein